MRITEQISSDTVSLAEFVKLLIQRLDAQKVPMPFQNEEKWHELFFQLKRDRNALGRPACLDRLRFDWDGPMPRCQDLSEYLQALHLNGFVSVGNPRYEKLSLDEDVREQAEAVFDFNADTDLVNFVDGTTAKAETLFAGAR